MASSLEHQALVSLVLECPPLLVWLLRNVLGIPLSDRVSIRPGPETIHELKHPDHHADGNLVLTDERDAGDQEAYVIEVQLGIDELKRWVWALYLSGTGLRLRCSASLVVITIRPAVERWCSQMFILGHGGLVFTPLVIGPSNIPRRIDRSLAVELPELAVLVVAAHGRGPGSKRTIATALRAIHTLEECEPQRAARLRRLVLVFVPEGMVTGIMSEMERNFWEQVEELYFRRLTQAYCEKMLREGRVEGREKGRAEGREKGRAEGREKGRAEGREKGRAEGRIAAVLAVLEARGLVVSAEQRARIEAGADGATLDLWVRRAALAPRADDLF